MFKSSFSGKAGALILAASIAFTGMSLPVFAESNVSGSEATISENDTSLETETDATVVTNGYNGDDGIDSSGNYLVNQDVTISRIGLGGRPATITIESGCTLTIRECVYTYCDLTILGGGTLMLSASCLDEVLICDGASLTIGEAGASGPTIRGAANKRPRIIVGNNNGNNAALTIYSGNIYLNGNANENNMNDGIYIRGSAVIYGGNVNISGGRAGVYIQDGGSFRINGGSINITGEDEGVYIQNGSSFEITGGVLDIRSASGAIVGETGTEVVISDQDAFNYMSSGTIDGNLTDTTLADINADLSQHSLKHINISLKGTNYTITYDYAGGTPHREGNRIIYSSNTPDFTLNNPTRYGYAFAGWTGTGLASPTMNVTIRRGSNGNRAYTATWRRLCIVRFDTNGIGEEINEQIIEPGRKAVKPADPYTTGSTFGGWFTDPACTQAYDFNSPVTRDMTLYAKWTRVVSPTDPDNHDPNPNVNPSNPDNPNPNVNPSNPEDTTEVRKDPVQVNNFVERMYTKALKRASEEGGKNDWANQLLTGKSDGAALAKGFICSNEFVNKDMSNEEFIDTLYETFFDRPADEGGKATWLAKLNEGNSRTSVLAGFVNSTEFGNLCENFGIARGTMEEDGSSIYNEGVYNFVKRNYTKTLGRNGEIAGIEDWCHRINTGKLTMKDVAVEFLHSKEFLNKNLSNEEYVKVLYRTFLGREADASGLADWTGQLDRGEKTRDEIVSGFSDSQEFNDIMKQYQ